MGTSAKNTHNPLPIYEPFIQNVFQMHPAECASEIKGTVAQICGGFGRLSVQARTGFRRRCAYHCVKAFQNTCFLFVLRAYSSLIIIYLATEVYLGVVAFCDVLISELAHLFINEVNNRRCCHDTIEVAPVCSFTCCIKYRQI